MGQPHDPAKRAAVVAAVCEQIATGLSLRQTCRQEGMPDPSLFLHWLDEQTEEAAAYKQQYARARELQGEAHADEIIEIADAAAGCSDMAAVVAARLRVDTRKWIASKLASKRYGDKLALGGDADGTPLIVRVVKYNGGAPDA